jgi:metal-responsive CopG/Arc/MetJ family transcriptional regulator
MTEYKTVRLPGDMINEINKIRRQHPEFGYRTHTEFIVEAIRKRLEEIKRLIKEN